MGFPMLTVRMEKYILIKVVRWFGVNLNRKEGLYKVETRKSHALKSVHPTGLS